jgi:hypothetical protein
VCIFACRLLAVLPDAFSEVEEYAVSSGKPCLLCIWGTGLRIADDFEHRGKLFCGERNPCGQT